jgi:cytochrome c biogenesis protein CcmG/thiol:disulfide interchange protein DsbE
MWRYVIPVLMFVGVAILALRGLSGNPGYVVSPFLGKPAPEFELPTLQDPSKTLGDDAFAGKTSLFNVWATWCVGCRQEHAFLNEVSKTSGVPIYGLNWKDDRDSALRWLSTLGNPYADTAFDNVGDVAIDWGVYGAPETFLIGRDGTVLYKHIAPLTPDVWQQEFIPRITADCGAYPCQ